MAKDLSFVLLLDCYGSLLTPRQRQMMQLYYDADLSLGEIAQDFTISRQGVRDSIKRSEEILLDMEAHLQMAARLTALRKQYDAIEAAVDAANRASQSPSQVQLACGEALRLLRDGRNKL